MREALHLRQRYRAIASQVGLIQTAVGVLMLVPLLTLPDWPGERAVIAAYAVPSLILVPGGLLVFRRLRPEAVALTLQEGGVIVVLSWVCACLASAVPLMIVEGLDFTEGVFEAVSGWTTTGLSVLDVAVAHPATLLWRSTMQLAGGAGFAILMLASITGSGGSWLSAAEGRTEQLAPNVRASARIVLRIYSGLAVTGVLALRLAGMSWFDAVNHAFCAVSTGGFSTRTESIGHWDSPAVEAVTIPLMVLGSMNFVTVWLLLRGRLGPVARNGEVRLFAVLLPVCALLLLGLTCAPLYESVSTAGRVAVFESVSALTTTGFSTVTYGSWNAFGWLVLLALMLVGGAACSTAGGLKQHRVYLLYRCLLRDCRRPFLSRNAVVDDSVWEGEEPVAVSDTRVRTVATFAFLYLATYMGGAAVLAAHGHDVKASLFEFASALGTVGLSAGVTGPDAAGVVLWTETAGMLLGRLEFFVILTTALKIARDWTRMGFLPSRESVTVDSSW